MPSKSRWMNLFLAAAVAATGATTACASGGSTSASAGGSAAAAQPSSVRRDASVITKDELNDPAVRTLNVLEAIKSLRPNFLASRGTQTIVNDANRSVVDPESGKVHAAIDDGGVLSVEELKRIPVEAVLEIRLLGPAAAMQRYGSTAKQGPVIVVRTM